MNLTIDHIKDRLKDEISILEVASALGILDKYDIKKTGNTYLGDCPTGHASANHQCFGLNTEENYYHCFHCNQAGDIISLVQFVQQIGYKQAGLNFHLHSLRHTFGTKLAVQGEDIRVISELLGHKDIRISTIYSKGDTNRLKGAIDRLGNNLVTELPKSSKTASERSN
jgi:hypothetical protein